VGRSRWISFALSGHRPALDDNPEDLDEEQDTEYHGGELTGMQTHEIGSLEQTQIGKAGGLDSIDSFRHCSNELGPVNVITFQ
jgi:hypothetical protein